jgi:DNA polymerase delta subunit 1
LTNQLTKPLTRIFKPVLPNLGVLFSGDHTRSIAMVVPKTGGIVGFTRKRLQCLQCKTVLKKGQTTGKYIANLCCSLLFFVC